MAGVSTGIVAAIKCTDLEFLLREHSSMLFPLMQLIGQAACSHAAGKKAPRDPPRLAVGPSWNALMMYWDLGVAGGWVGGQGDGGGGAAAGAVSVDH